MLPLVTVVCIEIIAVDPRNSWFYGIDKLGVIAIQRYYDRDVLLLLSTLAGWML
jgi:hypothetical protein